MPPDPFPILLQQGDLKAAKAGQAPVSASTTKKGANNCGAYANNDS
jgi:hypothetical protein